MKRNKGLTLIVALLLIITTVALCIAMYAWARYTTQSSGNVTAQIAKWNFNLRLKEGKAGATETSDPIDLASTQFNYVANDRIAPGTSGLFYVIVDTTGTEVDCQYNVNITLSNCPRNIKFYRGTDANGEELSLGGVNSTSRSFNFSKYLAVKRDVNGTITNENGKYEEPIYWVWDYSGTIEGSSTTYDEWDTIDSNLGTTTMTITATGTEMLEEPSTKASLVSQITALNYGQPVSYSVTVKDGEQVEEGTDGAVTLDNWKIFYNDGTYVYMIYGDYLPNSVAKGVTKVDGNSYAVNFDSSSRINFINALKTQNNWKHLLTPELIGVDGIKITGSPTVEQYSRSWNQKYLNNKIYINYLENMDDGLDGCYVGSVEGNTSNYTDCTNTDLLYYPHNELYGATDGYWLASPSTTWYGAVTNVLYVGSVGYRGGANLAVRPLIGLPSSILGEYTNGAWNIE